MRDCRWIASFLRPRVDGGGGTDRTGFTAPATDDCVDRRARWTDEEGEEDAITNDLQLAWENLETAKLIWTRQGHTASRRLGGMAAGLSGGSVMAQCVVRSWMSV